MSAREFAERVLKDGGGIDDPELLAIVLEEYGADVRDETAREAARLLKLERAFQIADCNHLGEIAITRALNVLRTAFPAAFEQAVERQSEGGK